MRYLTLLLTVVMLAVCGAEAPSVTNSTAAISACTAPVASGVDQNGRLILYANTFWNTSMLGPYATAIAARITAMPATLKVSTGLTDAQRASQLQWAMHAANDMTAGGVTLVVPSCGYDFTSFPTAHIDTPAAPDQANAFLPKLFVARDNLTVQGETGLPPSSLYYGNTRGRDGLHYGRVLFMVPSGRTSIVVRNLRFQGNHSQAFATDPDHYIHENSDALVTDQDRRQWHGLVMIGLMGGGNGVTVDGCTFEGISYSGIHIIGNATVTNSSFTGVIPEANQTSFGSYIEAIQTSIGSALGGAPVGAGFNCGISQNWDYGPQVYTGNSFSNFMEGVFGTEGQRTVTYNTFQKIADHGVYVLASNGLPMHDSLIEHNSFNEIYSPAIKVGGWTYEPDPLKLSGAAGGRHSSISWNTFQLLHSSAILMSGTFNTVQGNSITPYTTAADPTSGDFYDPASTPHALSGRPNVYPDFWVTTHGGQQGWNNHTAFNRFIDNTKGAQPLSLFFSQAETNSDPSADRSNGFNFVSGAGQTVYFQQSTKSRYAPVINLAGGANLVMDAPHNCDDCCPSAPYGSAPFANRRTSVVVSWIKALPWTVPHLLVRYADSNDLFLIGENGVHQKLNDFESTVQVLATADLTGDGKAELYYRLTNGGSPNTIYGSYLYTNYATREVASLSSPSFTFSTFTQQPLMATPVRFWSGANEQLVTAYTGLSSLYGSTVSGGNPVIDAAIYTSGAGYPAGSAVTRMQRADLSIAGELSGNTGEELYLSFNNGVAVGLYRPAGGSYTRQFVYNGQPLNLMTPGRLRTGDVKARMYQRFASTTVWETARSEAPGTNTLPGLDSAGSVFYGGSAPTDMLVAADLDGNGRDEMYSHYSDAPGLIYVGYEVNGVVQPNVVYFYNGTQLPVQMEKFKDAGGLDRMLSLFSGFTNIYLNQGLSSNGSDYLRGVGDAVWASTP